ncbi:hypothetical protein [Methylotenera sp.]|nr:hypothetical protein [Methylotenera sp.]MDI1298528.1 hypothetical protein [Methylotenera sp.]
MRTHQNNHVENNISLPKTNKLLRFAFQGLFVTAVFIVPPVAAINFLIV